VRFVVTALKPELSSPIDQRFGRTRCLLIIDLPDRTTMVIDNKPELHAAQDAGIQAAQKVIDSHADALITGHCGPKAFRALQAAGVTVYKVSDGSVAQALDRFDEGELTAAVRPDADMVIGRSEGQEQCAQ
jgi:predicted Fe-Mo cluster-binding NifX family protein